MRTGSRHSPGTNPWRRASRGRLARVGSSAKDCHTSASISAQPCSTTRSKSWLAAGAITASARPARSDGRTGATPKVTPVSFHRVSSQQLFLARTGHDLSLIPRTIAMASPSLQLAPPRGWDWPFEASPGTAPRGMGGESGAASRSRRQTFAMWKAAEPC
jgi:hypothetical protein